MAAKVTYRHNVMDIESIDTFFSIRGGYHNNIRDVYFIRALGECAHYSEKIHEIDRRMGIEIAKGRLAYIRIGTLSGLIQDHQIRTYSAMYDEWKQKGVLTLTEINKNDLLNETIANALLKTESVYRDSKGNVSESMLRNLGIKMLFWLEDQAAKCFADWNERSCVKIVLENAVKEQEYLFGYFLSLLGCDVLLLENRSDITAPDSIKQLSKTMILGDYGDTKLDPYSFHIPDEQEEKEKEKANAVNPIKAVRETVTVVIPEHIRRNRPQRPNTAMVVPTKSTSQHAPVMQENRPNHVAAGPNSIGREKSFEELAQMASSIVMITVHNAGGEVIGTGSGIMIGRSGYILTNHHVIAGGKFYSVRIEDDETIYPTYEVIKYNSTLDMAVIRIDKILKPLPVYDGRKKLVRGQKVVAIGSPLGMFNSVSDGIISGFRNIRDTDMIQFTAPISPGSSGGAVLNVFGEVIGISTAGIDNGQNINLAVGYEDILMFAKGFIV